LGILKPSSILLDTPSKLYSQNTQNLCVSKERYTQVRQNKAKRNIKKYGTIDGNIPKHCYKVSIPNSIEI